jgi:[acyl-carrier-protein] S-malonyltransferase
MSDFVFLFPGQGSQSVGMGKSLWSAYASVKELFTEASDMLRIDLAKLCFEGPESTLVQTENVQPAITLVNLAVLRVLRDEGIEPCATAGHSLGEYAALCAAGVLSVADTMRLVAIRGAAMKLAASRAPGGMSAVFGLDAEQLAAICQEAAGSGSVEIANHNSPKQVVLTGETTALQRAAELAKKSGAKLIIPLKVSGPWHSRFMATAAEEMRARLTACSLGAPTIPVVANAMAEVYADDPEQIREGLVQQLVRPVLWNRSMRLLLDQGHRNFLEVGPGKVLSGLMRDIDREAKVSNVQDVDTLAKLLALRSAPIAS